MKGAVVKRRPLLHSPGHLQRVYGIDFSGAANAGKKIWITGGVIEKGALRIKDCYQAEALPGSGNERDKCMAALRDFIMKERTGAFGLDFPFGLPRSMVKEKDWEDFILSFPRHYPSAEEFRKASYKTSGGSELKRITDRECQTPFFPYNLRLYRQTYFGICEVLAPLVRSHSVCVLPMQKAIPGRPWLLEVCPASTLKQEHLYFPYKGRTKSHDTARTHILEWIEESCAMSLPRTMRLTILRDHYGDALDSVIAAFAIFRALRDQATIATIDDDAYLIEGYVYI
ncbi:MAG: hypothetical protein NG747_07950 [Candidatus Brocadia sp.]|nr:hypothetical protein [Candidatus Brocadia sp.]